ncbi:MAG: esterase [Bacteroidetes bacterium]|nr:MAG: esterase [Bacteroidota bacterium]
MNALCQNTLVSHLGIKVTHLAEGEVLATMPVDDRTRQPMGFLHGGASLAFAETVASIGSLLITDLEAYDIFGTQVSGNHLRSVRSGEVYARASLLHKGRSSHLWDCTISDPRGKLIASIRVVITIVKKR